MSTVCIVIPIYKETPSSDEILSLSRTLETFEKYPLSLVCPDSLDISYYEEIAEGLGRELHKERFNDSFFNGIAGYNRLMLSECFYRRFQGFNFILICQPDAYVFRDELMDWCKKGYDYVGAPLIGNYEDQGFSTNMRVGNGGFSLRNVKAVLLFFESKKNVFSSPQIARRISLRKKPYTRFFVWLLMVLGWRNKPRSVAEHWRYNEDDFWSGLLDDSRFALKKPSPEEAMRFSFERFPSELYELNGRQLPFGCHAWRKYQFDEFWKNWIGKELPA